MKLRKFGIAVLILMLVFGVEFAPVSPQIVDYFSVVRAYWGTDRPTEVSPGDTATLSVVLRYEYQYSIRSLKAELPLPDGFVAVGGGQSALAYYTGTISLGSIIKLDFSIFITKDAPKGSYTSYLLLDYHISDLARWRSEALAVHFEVTGKPNLDASSLSDSLYEGKQQVSIIIQNSGDAPAENLELVRVSSNSAPVELKGNTVLGRLEPSNKVTIPIQIYVSSNLKGNLLTLIVETTYNGPQNVFYSMSKNLLIPVKSSIYTPTVTISAENEELVIGKFTNLHLKIRNTGNHSLANVRIDLAPDTILKIFGNSTFYMDKLASGQTRDLFTRINVPSTTTAQTSSLTVTATYLDEVLGVVLSESPKINLPLKAVVQMPALIMAMEPAELTVGKLTVAYIKITNTAVYTLTDMRIDISPDAVLKIFGNTTFQIDHLDSGENRQISTKLYVPSTTLAETASLTVTATYFDTVFGTVQSENQKTNLFLSAVVQMPVLVAVVEPEELTIGKSTNVSLKIANTGNHGLSQVKIDLSSDAFVKAFGSTTFQIEKLDPGESKLVSTNIYVPSTTTSPTTTLSMASTYFDKALGVVLSESQKLNLLLRGFIDISLTDMAVIPSTPPPGTSFSVSITITNIGTSTAYATYAIPLIGKLPLKTFGPKSVYIGNVEINQPTTFTVNLQMDSTNEKTITLPIALSYIDNLRSQYNMTITASITVGTTQPTTQPQSQQRGFEIFGIHLIPLVLLVGISAAVIVVFVIVRRRKRRTE